jgi:ABC-2 type transport system permease protein
MNALTGTGGLLRLILRRDRVSLLIWMALLTLVPISMAASYIRLYPTAAAQQAYATEISSSLAEVGLLGPVYAATIGGLTAWRASTAGAILMGAFSLITLIRHTRGEEEAGRRELLGGTVVGRHAPLTAALLVTLGADLLIGLLMAGALAALGLPAAGSLAMGLSFFAFGALTAALAALAAQLTQSAGAARAIVAVCLGLFYLLRAVGDMSGTGIVWLSPMGWMRGMRPFAGEQWGAFLLLALASGALIAIAYVLSAQRDLGAGILRPRSGRADAAPGLRNPLALAWHLQRGMLVSWAALFAVIGAVFGLVVKTGADQLAASAELGAFFQQIGGSQSVAAGFFTLLFMIMGGEVLAVYAILAALRLREEENAQHAELVLAGAVGRLRWALSHWLFAALGPFAILLALGLCTGLTYGLSGGDVAGELPRMVGAALAYTPAIWVLAGVTVALLGWLPRLSGLSWIALIVCVIIDLGGEFQFVSQAVLNLSPFTHVPRLLAGQPLSAPWWALLVVATLLGAFGLAGIRRRDIGA